MSLAYAADTTCPQPQVLHLDSRNASHPTSRDYYNPVSAVSTGNNHHMQADCEFYLPYSITTPPNCTLYAQVLHCTVGSTFYNVVAGVNDQVTIDVGNPATETVLVSITLDPGHYTNAGLAAHLQLWINRQVRHEVVDASGALQNAWPGTPVFDVTVTYVTSLRKLRVSLGPLQTPSFRLAFLGNEHGTLRELFAELGLRSNCGLFLPAGSTYSHDSWNGMVFQPDQSFGIAETERFLQFPLACDIGAATRNVHIRTSLTAGEGAMSSGEFGLKSKFLAGTTTPCNVMLACAAAGSQDPDSAISLVPVAAPLQEVNSPSIHHIRVVLTTNQNMLLDLNGGSFQISIRLQWVYSGKYRKPTHSRADQLLKFKAEEELKNRTKKQTDTDKRKKKQ